MSDLACVTNQFEADGEPICLEFANTLRGSRARPQESLHTYGDLIGWAHAVGVLSEAQAEGLLVAAASNPGLAVTLLQQALQLREAIFHLFAAGIDSEQAPLADLAILNNALAIAATYHQLVYHQGSFKWGWTGPAEALDRPLWVVAVSAAELLAGPSRPRVRRCASPTCDWLFIDRSRNQSRSWCAMADCGNRAKARRHYHRQRAAGATGSGRVEQPG